MRCNGVCGRVQTAINGSYPLDALVTEHLTLERHFSGLTWESWQPAATRHPGVQRKSRSALTKSGLQLTTMGGTLVTRASRGDREGLTPARSSPLFLSEGGKRLTQDVVLVGTIVTPLQMLVHRLQGVAERLSRQLHLNTFCEVSHTFV